MQRNERFGYLLATGAMLITAASLCVDKNSDQPAAQNPGEIAIVKTYTPTPSPDPAYMLVPTPLLTYSPTPVPTPVYTDKPIETPAYVSDSFRDLERQLESKVREYESWGANIALSVTDLQTGETISVDGDEPHVPACVINQMAVYAMVKEFAEGRADIGNADPYIRVGVRYSNPGSIATGLEYTFGSYEAGVKEVQEFMNLYGISGTYNHVPDQSSVGEWTDNILTTNSANRALAKLYKRELFNDQWTSYVLEVMTYYHKFTHAIVAGTDPDETVAHKIGWYPGLDGYIDGDSGLVMFTDRDGNEKAFAITILSQENIGISFSALASEATRTANDYFRSKY